MKTYSACTYNGEYWVTNWGEYLKLEDIDFEKVKSFCERKGLKGYGYVYGHNSRDITSDRNRTVISMYMED